MAKKKKMPGRVLAYFKCRQKGGSREKCKVLLRK